MSKYGLELTTVPRDLYYVERALVQRQAHEIVRLRMALRAISDLSENGTLRGARIIASAALTTANTREGET